MINAIAQIGGAALEPAAYPVPRSGNATGVSDAIAGFLDLSAPSRALHEVYEQPAGFKASFLKQLAQLIAHGIVGTETIVSGAETRERFITAGIGSQDVLARRVDIRA